MATSSQSNRFYKGDIAHEMVAFLKEHGTPFERDDAALTVLERWGTMSFEEVAGRAIEYARDGFVLRPRTARAIERELDFINEWPGNQSYWLKPDGSLYKAGETIAFPKTARTLSRMISRSTTRASKSRPPSLTADIRSTSNRSTVKGRPCCRP